MWGIKLNVMSLCSKCKALSNWESNIQKYRCSKCDNIDVNHEVEAKKLLDKGSVVEFFQYCHENLDIPWERKKSNEIGKVLYCEEDCEAGMYGKLCCKFCDDKELCRYRCSMEGECE